MRKRIGLVGVGALMFVVWGVAEAAAQDQNLEPSEEVEHVIVKRYADLSAGDAYQAVRTSEGANVRFTDSFDGRVAVPARFGTVRVGQQARRTVAAFVTEVGLHCLIASDDEESLQKAPTLRQGQTTTIEGTILGTDGARRCVLVDRILTGSEKMSEISHEIVLRWPGQTAKLILQPGNYTVPFPCNHVEGKTEQIRVLVAERDKEAFLRQIEKEMAEEEGEPQRTYGTYSPTLVYQYAKADRQIDVRFRDKFKGAVRPVPQLRVARIRGRGEIRIGYAFETYEGITCLVPAGKLIVMDKARRSVPGQTILVQGTISGRHGIYRCVVVDNLETYIGDTLAGKVEAGKVWEIKVFLPGQTPKMLYKPGTYADALTFPCQHKEGAVERFALELREVRLVRAQKEEPTPPEGPAESPTPGARTAP